MIRSHTNGRAVVGWTGEGHGAAMGVRSQRQERVRAPERHWPVGSPPLKPRTVVEHTAGGAERGAPGRASCQ